MRFKDDDGRDYPDWGNNILGELFEINAGGDIEKTHLRKARDSVFCYPVYANAENFKGLHGYSDLYRVSKDCITVSGRGVGIGLAHARFEKFYPIVRLLVLHPKNSCNLMFFEYAINELRIFNESTGVPQLTSPQLKTYRINFPDVEEQQKIAAFLSAVDTKIEQLNRKQSLLEQYKKGMMQKLFNQEIRFKDENGRDYPDWKEKRLGEIAKIHRGSGLSKSAIHPSGKIPCILYGELFTKYRETISQVHSFTDDRTRAIGKYGDILMPTSDVTPDGLATASALLVEGVQLGGDINIIRLDKGDRPVFMSYMINSCKRKVMRLVTGTTVKHIYPKDILGVRISIPGSLEEQQKIADFLSALDRKIALVARQIDQALYFKQGLLQRMFI